MSENGPKLDDPKPGFLLVLLHVLIAAAIGNVVYAGGALLMNIDSRLSCLGGLVVVLIAPLIVLVLVVRQTKAQPGARKALLSCWPILMLVPPMSSWVCEYLYWHLGTTGITLAFAAAVPLIAVITLWWCVGALRDRELWTACQRRRTFLAAGFASCWVVTAWLLVCICLGWDAIGLPAIDASSLPASISQRLTAFLPTTILLVIFGRWVAALGRRAASAPEEEAAPE